MSNLRLDDHWSWPHRTFHGAGSHLVHFTAWCLKHLIELCFLGEYDLIRSSGKTAVYVYEFQNRDQCSKMSGPKIYNLVYQSNSLDFSWKREEEAEMPVSAWRRGDGPEKQKAAEAYSPSAARRVCLHPEGMGRALRTLRAIQGAEGAP